MLSSFKVDEYLKVDNLNRVNLITGRNNTGKTAFLNEIFYYYFDDVSVPASFIMPTTHFERSGDRKIEAINKELEKNENGIVLIDGIEVNIHHSRYTELWELIREKAIKYNCQVFATTLSYECIASAFEVFSKYEPYELSFYNFSYKDFAIMVTYYDKETLQSALELGLEIRG
ncbi:MAG: GTPase domain-containing protein [Candidatus Micrarchaeia archaeon]